MLKLTETSKKFQKVAQIAPKIEKTIDSPDKNHPREAKKH
jgi:hypothetical protein